MTLLILFAAASYFLPSYHRLEQEKFRQRILALNFFLGWTVIGWIIASGLGSVS